LRFSHSLRGGLDGVDMAEVGAYRSRCDRSARCLGRNAFAARDEAASCAELAESSFVRSRQVRDDAAAEPMRTTMDEPK
jgi:hypothetical protein